MYNRYIPNGSSHTRITEQDPSHFQPPPKSHPSPPPPHTNHFLPPPQTARKNIGTTNFLGSLGLDELDSGDILLLLILLFLFRNGDDIELLITLGLILLIGLGDNEKNADRQNTVGV